MSNRIPRARFSLATLPLSLLMLGALTTLPTHADRRVLAGAPPEWLGKDCTLAEAVAGPDGTRRLALVVGVGQYAAPSIPDLPGPPNDARRVNDLLTGADGYGFPKANVCLLIDEEATIDHFRQAFRRALVDRATAGDVAEVFFAGHGSQTPDQNGDEPDEWDETLVLHDSRAHGVGDLVDDELNTMLAALHAKTRNVTVILDSCNSGTATRGSAGTFLARYVPPAEPLRLAPPATAPRALAGDGAAGWAPAEMPGLVVLSAASDGTSALESQGSGIFTDALLQVLSLVPPAPLSYAQVARRVPPLVASRSYQIPYFHGDLGRPVFGNETRTRPIGWDVTAVQPRVELSGPPLPGLGIGAELRVYEGSARGAATRDPAKAKATVVIDSITGVKATAKVSAARTDAPPLAVGDLAVLARPSDSYIRLKVRIRPANEPGGVPASEASLIEEAIRQDPEAHMLVEETPSAGDFELGLQPERGAGAADATLVLLGPENRIRNTYARPLPGGRIARDLWRHARQRALLQLQGENGADFRDDETLQVRLTPDSTQNACARGSWQQAEANREQVVPLCHRWRVEVTVAPQSPAPLLVGGLVLSTDGGILAFPSDATLVRVDPGKTHTFARPVFRGEPPLDVQDHVLVFGTQERNPVPWYLLTDNASTRSARAPAQPSALYRALDLYLRPGTRGQTVDTVVEDTTWTRSAVPVRVEANTRFAPAASAAGPPQRREYTIAKFDVRPYLPDSREAALYKVLSSADSLATKSIQDGVPYKQHPWNKETDEENLREGIDCSRAIWYTFTRAGLPYNSGDQYLSTAMMVSPRTLMSERFDDCSSDSDLRLGDVLVYRDEAKGAGHVVMVIDPVKRVAWGSHGWDGNVREGLPADTGVEYQLIKYKKDWQRWDRPDMERRACWRYRAFTTEARGIGQPGVKALESICDPARQCAAP